MRVMWVALVLVLVTGCGHDDTRGDATPEASPTAGYVDQVNALCRELLSQVLTFDIGNAVTIEQFLGKHEPLVAAIGAFDARVAAVPVAPAENSAADAFDAYRRFSDAADAKVVAAAETGDQETFEAANIAYLEEIRSNTTAIDAMHAAGIQCNAR